MTSGAGTGPSTGTLVFSIPTRRVAVIAGGVLLLSACSHAHPAQEGTALRATGPQETGVLGFPHAQVGKTYRFAFPAFENGTAEKLVIKSVKLTHIPEGVKVTGYPVYSVNDTNGYILDSQDGLKYPRDMTKMPNYAGKPITVRPHEKSDRYAMAMVRVTGKVQQHLKGCEITYVQNKQKYRQTLSCEFALDMK